MSNLLRKIVHNESSAGVIMMLFAALAILAVNSPFAEKYYNFINHYIVVGYRGYVMAEPIKALVKDFLMVFFFMLIGLELKREIKEGFLSKKEQIILPLVCALAGMLLPAAIYIYINRNLPIAYNGWAIPSATDIAFALAILNIFGKKIPPSVKIFLLAVAVFDDLGAIIIIAAFYNIGFDLYPFLLSLAGIFALFVLNLYSFKSLFWYFFTSVTILSNFYLTGIHTTLAGVLVALAIPMRRADNQQISQTNNLINLLHPWVNFFVLPIFAFVASGISFSGFKPDVLFTTLPLGIALGLFLGKQVGIFGSAYLFVKTKILSMPENAKWLHIYAVSVIAGIGFTMSLFIGFLAFSEPIAHEVVKVGVITGSLLSIMWGIIILKFVK